MMNYAEQFTKSVKQCIYKTMYPFIKFLNFIIKNVADLKKVHIKINSFFSLSNV